MRISDWSSDVGSSDLTNGPIETDNIAVQHWVGNDAFHQCRIFLRFAQAAGMWHLRAKAVLRSLRQTQQHWRQEDAGRYSHNPYLVLGEITGHGSGHAHDATLGRRIGRLSYLPIIGRDGGCVDHYPALLPAGISSAKFRRESGDHGECTDQLDLNHLAVDIDRKSTRLNSSHECASRMPSSA